MAEDNSGFDPNQFDLSKIAEKAAEIQQKMKKAHDDVANLRVTGESGGGAAKVVMNGRHEVIRIDVDEQTWNEGKAVVLDLISSAINNAVAKVEEQAQKKMQSLSKEMGIGDLGEQGGGSTESKE